MYEDEEEVDIAAAMSRRRAWVTDADMRALGLERTTGLNSKDGGYESHADQAKRLLREAAPMAASSLVRLAQHGESETVRLRASVEILNRVEAAGSGTDGREPWAEVYDKILSVGDVERFANEGYKG